MRWLQWSKIDLANGLGGVEVHARSIARELKNLGHEAGISSDPKALDDPKWDVIHTHGSAPLPSLHPIVRKAKGRRPILVHTLHGQTLGRMLACGEYTWPGGYLAAGREAFGVGYADVVLGVHGNLSLLKLAERLGKIAAVCSNGWDSSQKAETLDTDIGAKLRAHRPFWVFVGRGGDKMKGADALKLTFSLLPDLKWAAAPGEGFENCPEVVKTGRLTSGQIHTLLELADGFVLPSRYEGHPLVVLEALASGLPVAATAVGGLQALEEEGIAQGLVRIDSLGSRAIVDAIRTAGNMKPEEREQRAQRNRKSLPTWRKVTETCIAAVEQAREKASTR